MKEYKIQYNECRPVVWVHASDGSTVGRFDKRSGIDIHRTVTEQMEGKSQCLHCTHGKTTQKEWDEFVDRSKELWGVVINRDFISYT